MPFAWSEVNIWAALVAGLAAFFVGGAWYSGIFGKLWVKLHGFSPEKIKEMQARTPPPLFFGGMILSYLVLGLALALLMSGLKEHSALAGAATGFLVWLTVAAIGMTAHIASDKVLGLYFIDVGCELIYLVLMGALLGAWR
jgi:Protein of unknown function (DUF1761)